ncbi:MAG: serine protease [Candidatus Melainabacteria bacterium]|nr:MAG: serine protease [Candidatus Melainabacteria bacterium]
MAENGDDNVVKATGHSGVDAVSGRDYSASSGPKDGTNGVEIVGGQPGSKDETGFSLSSKLLISILVVNTFGVGIWIGSQFMSRDDIDSPRKPTPGQLETNEAELPVAIPHKTIIRNLGESTVADIAEKVAPAVVAIEVTGRNSAEKTLAAAIDAPTPQFFFGPRMRLEQTPQPFVDGQEKRSAGSGVIIREDGYILTNSHVARNDSLIKVTLNDKREFQGQLVGKDNFTDLALVKINATGLPIARLGTSKHIRPGEWAIAIGNPFGFEHTVTLGIVSAIGRSVADLNHHVELIQTDAAINPGNSGGPLLNLGGDVIGINTAIRYDAQNIGFAIPVDVAREVATGLLSPYHAISRPYLGIYMRDLDPKVREALSIPKDVRGVLVRKVAAGGPSNRAKLAPGDLIQKVNGVQVASSKDMREIIKACKPGDVLKVSFSRKGTVSETELTVGDYSKEVVDD